MTQQVILVCLCGMEAKTAAERLCANIHSALDNYRISFQEISSVLEALFKVQPVIALDTFLLSSPTYYNAFLFDVDSDGGLLSRKWN